MRQMPMSALEKMKLVMAEQAQRRKEPWFDLLQNVAGEADRTGIERIGTGHVLDLLRIPQARRTPQLFIRLTAVMRSLGWAPCRMRDFNAGGYREQLRGFARAAQRKPLRGVIPSSGLKQRSEDVS
jgi:hypothetical protein